MLRGFFTFKGKDEIFWHILKLFNFLIKLRNAMKIQFSWAKFLTYSVIAFCLFCTSCFPATNSPVGPQSNFLLARTYSTVQHKQYFYPLLLPSSVLQHTRLTVLPLFWVFLLCLHFWKWIIFFCVCFCEKEKTKQNKWALWNVKEMTVKQQSWKRGLNCITNGSFYLIEKQWSR